MMSISSTITILGVAANKDFPSISADYILGINEIDLGPRVNDVSKM